MKLDLRAALQRDILTGDGAMGTYLYQMGFPVGISYEELNLLRPETVAEVHRRYFEAGARLIETNTFSANREKLSKYGLEGDVEAINRAGVELARKVVGKDAYVVGAIGSIRAGKRKNVRTADVEESLREQISILLDSPVDGLMLETFYDLEELQLALRIIRSMSDLPVICQFANEGTGSTQDGVPLQEAFLRLRDEGADVIGFNCRVGPNGILRSMEKLTPLAGVPFSAFPNAGLPDYVDGQYTYAATPQYFAESALRFADLGARIIGGCCGTTPEHIAAVAKALQDYVPAEPGTAVSARAVRVLEPAPAKPAPPAGKPSLLEIVKQRKTVIVELDPPRDLDIDKFMQGSRALQDAHVDAITMADNSLAVTRMSNLALGHLVQDKLGARPLIHIACRDRNMIGTQSHLMGLHALGIDHVLAVTGDPAKFGDLPGSSSVYDLTSFEIIRMIKQLNEGIAFSGKPLKQKANFVVGAAFNPNVKHLDKAVQRLERKIEAGADYIMTQPVYDAGLIEQIYEATKHLHIPVFIGIAPLASGGNAEYLHNEVPGIRLSDEVRARMSGLKGPEGRAMGVEIAKELLDAAMPYFNGIYLMTPFLAYEMCVDLTKYVWEKSKRHDFHLYPLSK
ncbi:bifunctional homocysteine S-methyltransferase/methylenetetrahydrofolate reductase [Paenibacillus sp. CGMCC 1.16610]|uniref:Bifunctional homocysteine S-methyltransferase/methylenetetrahydrofolate reductase n=2 Tax=Paenibacillus TaxID=44249 RepID=A0ABW9UCH1_9BACL|nr:MULTISPECIES: bifunctional homocysteine S-methyltransferase/methylenetetrahydrofolate reductase [Paenibacillus]MBA2937937.1 bifunctional homocysteine S-methyltransferase/methylenetetrahydrofolate reductase [Paenibacillus sp. CGMCC 1.16610]MVQ36995.1 bifunctional homocysteine S-methyltransferase/methylenetetrahydrofolate reductase [Paenibacillus anseongense]